MASVAEANISGVRVISLGDEAAGLALSVAPKSGGELSSLRVRRGHRWIELLHRANRFEPSRNGWRGRAPWLFPAVGRSSRGGRIGCYALEEQVYPMPIHGFVMDREWTFVSADAWSIVCRTASDAATRAAYPFDFELTVVYSLLHDGFSSRAEILSSPANRRPMPFSLGNHLTLAIPFGGGDAGACSVRTPAGKSLLLSPQGLLTGESVPVSYGEGAALRDDPRLCDMMLSGFPSDECWVEVRDPSAFGVRVRQNVATDPMSLRFVLYSDPSGAFLCPEPWHGEPDSLNTGRALVWLAPGERFEWEMEIMIV